MSLGTTIAAVAIVAVPGIGCTFALFEPGRASLPTRLGLVFPFGFATIALVALVLALVHALYLPVLVGAYVVATGAAWLVGYRRGRIGAHLAAWRRELVDDRWLYAFGALALLGYAAIRATYSPILNLLDQTPLRYWADGVEIADAHRIPGLALHWGLLFPPTVSKIALNAFNGAMSLVLGRGPLAPMGALLFVVSIGLFLAALGLARELGLRLTAPLLAVLLFANRVLGSQAMTSDLVKYRAENWGRLVILGAVLLAVRALRATDLRAARLDALAGGVLLGVGAGTHLVPFSVGVAFAGAYLAARMVVRRRVLEPLKVAAAVLGAAIVVGGFVLLTPRGDVGFQGAASRDAYRQLGVELGLGASWDPTLYLAKGRIHQAPHQEVHGFYQAPSFYYEQYVRAVSGTIAFRRIFLILFPVGILITGATMLVWGSADLKALALAAVLLGLSLEVATLYFAYRYDVYALAQFGPRRLDDYYPVPILLLVLGALEVALTWVARRPWRAERARTWAGPVAAGVALAVVVALAYPKATPPSGRAPFLTTGLPALAWIEREVPCEGAVLADRRTLATFETFSRHSGVLEGMGPYLRPDLLTTAIRNLLAARQFFLHPDAGESFLSDNNVAAVVVTRQPLGGTSKVARVKALIDAPPPFLREAFRTPSVVVYAVSTFDPAASRLPDLALQPGFHCGS